MTRLLATVSLLVGCSASAQVVRGPYLQLATTDSVTVVWRTATAEESVVRYGAAPDALTSEATADFGTEHAVKLSGLAPDTRYFYSVGTTSQVRAPAATDDATQFYFRTNPPVGVARPVRFWVVGDDGTGDSNQAATIDSMRSYVGQRVPDLFVHVGDMAYNSGTDSDFTNHFFAPHAGVLRNTVVWPAMGNHEGRSSFGATERGPYFDAYVLPRAAEAGGVPSGTESYYSFDYANVHFIVLNSFDVSRAPTGAMATWLRSDLMATNQDWIIASFHHPPYSAGTHTDGEHELREMRTYILPILEEGGVDLVLAGHSHIYERSFLVNGAYATPVDVAGHIVDSSSGRPDAGTPYRTSLSRVANQGTVYVVAGHGGATLGGTANHPLMYFSEIAHGSCLVDVDGPNLELVNLRNAAPPVVSDSFAIVKEAPPDAGSGGARPSPSCQTVGAEPTVLLALLGLFLARLKLTS